jgi:hypothetical protein
MRWSVFEVLQDKWALHLWVPKKPVIMKVKNNLYRAREACVLPIRIKKPVQAGSWEDHHAQTWLNWHIPFASISTIRP